MFFTSVPTDSRRCSAHLLPQKLQPYQQSVDSIGKSFCDKSRSTSRSNPGIPFLLTRYIALDLINHEVAIKSLSAEFVQDSDRVSRFQREAEVLTSVNPLAIFTRRHALSLFARSRARLYPIERRARFMENTYQMAAKPTGTGFAPVLGGSL
jgi:hypothetical protein